MSKLIYSFGHVLTVNSRYYGRGYVKNLNHCVLSLKCHTHLEASLDLDRFKMFFTIVQMS